MNHNIEVKFFETVQLGLREFLDSTLNMAEILKARVDNPANINEKQLWNSVLYSKEIQLYGGRNTDGRYQFKVDHNFDLKQIVDSPLLPNGSILIDEPLYLRSKGTEFVIIRESDLGESSDDYAIRGDKYEAIRDELNKRKLSVSELEQAGGFKVCAFLRPEEIPFHDGLLEHTVGKNMATQSEYDEGLKLLISYLEESLKQDCFSAGDGVGLGFSINTSERGFKARPWCIGSGAVGRSVLSGRVFFQYGGTFFRR